MLCCVHVRVCAESCWASRKRGKWHSCRSWASTPPKVSYTPTSVLTATITHSPWHYSLTSPLLFTVYSYIRAHHHRSEGKLSNVFFSQRVHSSYRSGCKCARCKDCVGVCSFSPLLSKMIFTSKESLGFQLAIDIFLAH